MRVFGRRGGGDEQPEGKRRTGRTGERKQSKNISSLDIFLPGWYNPPNFIGNR
jgi:hypothetical protein